jgi:hypothetical protein
MIDVIGHVAIRLNKVPMFPGQFGVGKTVGAKLAAKKYKAFYHSVLLGQYQTVDLKGTPWADDMETEDGLFQSTIWRPASTLPVVGNPRFPKDGIILLHLDELTSAEMDVMGVCYQLINERRIGEHVLMDNVRIVCSGNREIDRGIVKRMPLPLCNRMVWYEVVLDPSELVAHGSASGWAPMMVAFLAFREALCCTYDPAKPEKVVATPRTIEMADEFYRDYEAGNLPESIMELSIAGSVGDGWCREFLGYRDQWSKVEALLPQINRDPANAPIPNSEEELGLRYAITVHLSNKMNIRNVKKADTYLKRLGVEFLTLAWTLAIKRDEELYDAPEFDEFAKTYNYISGR